MNWYQRGFIRLAYRTWSRERQWLSHTGEDKKPVASQSMKLGDSAVLTWCCKSGGFLERHCSSAYVWTLRNLVLILVKDCSSDRMGGHAGESEANLVFYLAKTRRCRADIEWVFPFQIILSRKFLTGAPSILGFVYSRSGQVGYQD